MHCGALVEKSRDANLARDVVDKLAKAGTRNNGTVLLGGDSRNTVGGFMLLARTGIRGFEWPGSGRLYHRPHEFPKIRSMAVEEKAALDRAVNTWMQRTFDIARRFTLVKVTPL